MTEVNNDNGVPMTPPADDTAGDMSATSAPAADVPAAEGEMGA